MKSSRRPFDRSREPDLKKPRLAEELERGPNPSVRQFQQKPVPPATNLGQSRFRASDRDSESSDSGRGGYQPQPPQHHELVIRYKTALAELTFNSKPIITNLTIIAGESLHAAKAIAAIICGNILEVPNEQKLPSLYLLDSIVKNIGRDYIKYFAARLPEVFCKAYRQVDPSVHQSMRHLFGTWKGVFPPQSLQIIEKELAFVPATNGSASGSVTSRPDSQSQRPPHSIHVNPKYLERQRFQQSSGVKGMTNDVTGVTTSLSEDAVRPERAGNISAGRPWMDSPVEMLDIQHPHRDALSGTTLEKKTSVAYGGDYEYDNDLARNSGMGRRIIDKGHDKPWLGASSNVAETFSQRNGFTNKLGISNYPSTKSVSSSAHPASMQNHAGRSSSALSTSWKNSEEEEFVWDDMNSKLSDYGAPSISKDPRKDHLNLDESEKLSVSNHLRKRPQSVQDVGFMADRETSSDLFFSEQKVVALGQCKSSPWQLQESHLLDEPLGSGSPTVSSGPSDGFAPSLSGIISGATSTVGRTGVRSQVGSSNLAASGSGFLKNAVSGSVGSGGKKKFQALGAALPSGQSHVSQKPPSPSLPVHLPSHQLLSSTELDEPQIHPLPHPNRKASSFSGNLSVGPRNLQKTQPQYSRLSSSSLLLSQPRNQFPISHSQQDSMRSEVSDQTQKKPLLPPFSNQGTPSTVGNSGSDNLRAEMSGKLAAVMKSGIFSNNSNSISSIPNISFQEMELMEPDISGPSSTQLASTEPTSGSPASASASRLTNLSSLGSVSSDTSNVVNNSLNPVSNLLSSLVAKGLISSSKAEMPNITKHQMPAQLEIQKSRDAITSSVPVTSVPVSSVISISSTKNEMSFTEPADKSSVILPQSSTSKINNLIGFEFRPDVIRELHPPVISKLFDDIPHQCSICGVRLKLREQLDRHLQSHASKNLEANSLNNSSRRWYPNSSEWIAGKAGLLSESESACSAEQSRETANKNDEPMVPADEDQFACVLCGQFFEDVYSLERDEWMFKGAVHMTMSTGDGELGSTNESTARGPIVHANCITGSSVHDERLSPVIKMERDI